MPEEKMLLFTMNDSIWGEVQYFIEKEIHQCEKLWRSISDTIYLTDLWEYRYCFHQAFSKKPYFVYASSKEKVIAFLALEFLEMEGGYFSFFGGGVWNEQNRVYALPNVSQEIINKIYELAPPKSYLHSIPEVVGKLIPFAKPEMETYFVDCGDLNDNIDNLYARMSNDSRKSVKRYIRMFQEMNPDIKINQFEDIDAMIALNKVRFGEDSTFCKPFFEDTLKRLLNIPELRPYLRMLSIRFGGDLKSCALTGFYKGSYIYIASGTDETLANLPKFLVHTIITDALNLHAQIILMLSYDCGWKDRYRLNKYYLYLVEKGFETS